MVDHRRVLEDGEEPLPVDRGEVGDRERVGEQPGHREQTDTNPAPTRTARGALSPTAATAKVMVE